MSLLATSWVTIAAQERCFCGPILNPEASANPLKPSGVAISRLLAVRWTVELLSDMSKSPLAMCGTPTPDSVPGSTTATIDEYLLWMVWTFFSTTPSELKNPKLDVLMPTVNAFEDLFESTKVAITPQVLGMVYAAAPPTLQEIQSLPSTPSDHWAVYILTLERIGQPPMVYIGSGTSSSGVQSRFANYDNWSSLPSLVEKSLLDGYTITHKGVLCSAPCSSYGSKVPPRGLFLLLESVFANVFLVMEKRDHNYGLPCVSPWTNESVEYFGLCSHSAIHEGIRGEDEKMTPAERLEWVNLAKARKQAQKTARYYDFKANNFEAWKARQRDNNMKYLERHPDMVQKKKENLQSWYIANRESGRYKCSTCNISFSGRSQLELHYTTRDHAEKSAGVTRKVNSKFKAWSHRNKEQRRYTCDPCGFNALHKGNLNAHYKTKNHLNRMAAFTTAAETPEDEIANGDDGVLSPSLPANTGSVHGDVHTISPSSVGTESPFGIFSSDSFQRSIDRIRSFAFEPTTHDISASTSNTAAMFSAPLPDSVQHSIARIRAFAYHPID